MSNTFHLSKEEKLELQNSVLKIENHNLAIEMERVNQEKLIDSICKRLNIEKSDIKDLNIYSGLLTTITKDKEEVKK